LKTDLGAAFFFSRDSVDRRRTSNILPTIVYQLAYSRPALRRPICDAIEQDPDVASRTVQAQFQKLISEALTNVQEANLAPFLIVIDALDECDKEGGREGGLFIPLLASHLRSLPFRVKILMTSRPEASIRKMLQIPSSLARLYMLHDIDATIVQADIGRYLQNEFIRIADEHDVEPPWPTLQQLQDLITRAGCLFIYASTAVKFVSESNYPKKYLATFLSADSHRSRSAHATLDSVYMQILQSITRDKTGTTSTLFRDIVGAIVILQYPLSKHVLGRLLEVDTEMINGTLRSLYSLLDIPASANRPIRIFHPSFADFLTSRERCTDNSLYVDVGNAHLTLAIRCIKVMNGQLRQNICEIGDASLLNSEIKGLVDRQSKHISEELRYASVHWMLHVTAIEELMDANELKNELEKFCTYHLLHWIEVLSLRQELRSATEELPRVYEWCKVCTMNS
jgi:hypothetical protein